jgi:hypothetical protein
VVDITNKNFDDIMELFDFYFKFRPHDYQKKFFKACFNKKRLAGKWCRQSGKSHSVAVYVLFKALTTPNITIILIAPTQNQSKELYNKIRFIVESHQFINSSVVKSTETELRYNNKSRIISLPCGPHGHTIRGYTADIVVLEEAGIMKDEIVNSVIIPMLASKGDEGQLIKIGTPLIRNHFYRSCYEDPEFEVINVTWKDCVKAGQYTQSFIDEQQRNSSDIEFKTEYEGEFIDDVMSFFPAALLDNAKSSYPMVEIL